eukprot:gene4425-20659_t
MSQQTLYIKVFGDEEGTLKTCDVVQFCIRSPNSELSVYVTAFVFSKFWDLESIGIRRDEATVYESFQDEIKFVDGRYQLVNSFYFDNVNTGGYDKEEAIELYKVAKEIVTERDSSLRKWVSNSKQVMAQISFNESQQDRLIPNDLKTTEDDQSFAKTSLKQCGAMESEENKV